jgi:hydrogenase maturation protease
MSRTSLIVGLGNPLLGADAFGPAVLEQLRGRADLPPGTELIDAGTDLLGCLDRLTTFDHVVLVDAVLGVGTGAVTALEESVFAGWSIESPGSHDVSALLAVALFRRLYPHARTRISLVGLEVDRIARDRPLTADATHAGVQTVMQLIAP